MNNLFFTAIVEDRFDPLELGRVRVRVFGVHSELLADVPVSSLPWAITLMPATSASISGIGHSPTQYIEGSQVMVYFLDGESKQQPVIIGSWHGIPLHKTPFGESGNSYSGETFEDSVATQTEINKENKDTVTDETDSKEDSEKDSKEDSKEKPKEDSKEKPKEDSKDSPCCSGVNTTRAVKEYGPNVNVVCKALCDAGIKDKNAIIAILANVAKESRFQPVREKMNYSTVAAVRASYKTTFESKSDEEVSAYLNDEKKLANFAMANKTGNGPESSGDGYKYRGGGYIQLTSKGNYKEVGSKIGVDLVNNPDDIIKPEVAAKATAQFFISAYGGANRIAFNSVGEALEGITRKVNPRGFERDIGKVKNAAVFFADTESDTATADAKSSKSDKASNPSQPNKPENDLKKNATREEINAGLVNGKPVTSSSGLGFSDPNKKYPLDALLKEQDINRLSRRNTKLTLVETKQRNRRSGIPSIGSSFSEPATAYNARYPFNQIYQSESGHALEFDDTTGNERINLYHTAGTFIEIDKFGNQTNKIVGDSFSITERNGYIYIDGVARLTVGSDVKIVVGGSLDIQVEGDVNYDVGGSVTWKIGGDLKYGIGGKHSVRSGGITAIDSAMIHLNSGVADSIGFSSRDGGGTDYPLQIPENFIGSSMMEFDDEEADVVDAMHKREIAAGNITQKDLDDGTKKAKEPEKVDKKKPPPPKEPLEESCGGFSDKEDIPDGTQLSKSFTLGMVSSRAYYPHKVVAQNGLKKSEIVCNLKKLCENVLDPIKAKFPSMFITSGFRTGGGTSDHKLGQAADMQFPGKSKAEYFEIAQWIRDNVSFSQVILEYQTVNSGNPWIHIAYGGSSKDKVLTFMNHKSVGSGLRKLA